MGQLAGVIAANRDGWWEHTVGSGRAGTPTWGIVLMAMFVLFFVWLVRATAGGGGHPAPDRHESAERAGEIPAKPSPGDQLMTQEHREREELRQSARRS